MIGSSCTHNMSEGSVFCTNNVSEGSVFCIVYEYPLFFVIGSSRWYTPDLSAPRLGIKTATLAHLEGAKVENVERPICRTETDIDRAIERAHCNRVQTPVLRIDAPYTTSYPWATSWQTHWRFVTKERNVDVSSI